MTRLAGFDIDAPPAVVLPLFVAALVAIAAVVARVVTRLTARWMERVTPAGAPAQAPARVGIPVAGVVLFWGLSLVVPELAIPGRLGRWLGNAMTIALVLACALAVSRLAVAAVTVYAARNPSVNPALGVARVAVRLGVGILAVITGLQTLGVPVAPLLTTLGVGSLAVALALQETLANFFAGLYLLADRPVRTGDYIKIHDGEEGFVEAIGWRSSRLRTNVGNVVIVPNQKLSQAILTNYHLPSPRLAMTVPVTVAYDSDTKAVEAALAEELARAPAEVPEILADTPGLPVVLITALGDSGITFACIVSVRDVDAQGRASHELRKRILARLQRDGVTIPFPQRVVHTAPHT
jgi:small-conductance mechanosensitive channel